MNQRSVQFQDDDTKSEIDISISKDYHYILARALRVTMKISEEDLTLVEILNAYDEIVAEDDQFEHS